MAEAPFQKTWKVGDPVLAADLNSNIRNGYLYQLQNKPYARGHSNADTVVGTGAWTPINFQLQDFDGADNTFSVSNRMDIVVPGLYLVTGGVVWNTNATGGRAMRFTITPASGGAAVPQIGIKSCQAAETSGGMPTALTMTRLLYFAVGDVLRIEGFQTSGVNLNTKSGDESSALQVLFMSSATGIR